VSEYRFSARADRDLRSIVARIAREYGSRRAENYRSEIVRSIANIAEYPEMGHFRPDVTTKPVRFWAAYSHLIVYWPDSKPLRIARILHGALDPTDLRDRVGEPLGQYVVSTRPVIDVPLNAREQEYLDARVRSEGAANRADVLLGALRYLEDPDSEERQRTRRGARMRGARSRSATKSASTGRPSTARSSWSSFGSSSKHAVSVIRDQQRPWL